MTHPLIGCSKMGYPVLFTDSPPAPPSQQHQTHVSYEQNELKWLFGFLLCLSELDLSMEQVKRFFVYKCKLSRVLLYLADMFLRELNTKSNSLFWITWAVFPIPKPRTPDSTSKDFKGFPNAGQFYGYICHWKLCHWKFSSQPQTGNLGRVANSQIRLKTQGKTTSPGKKLRNSLALGL